MPAWLIKYEVWTTAALVLVPILIPSLLIWIVFSAACTGRARATLENLLIVVSFCSLGVTLGILAGSSKGDSGVSGLLPAVLSLVGGVGAYLVSRQSPEAPTPHDPLVPSAAVTALAVSLFVGALIGADMRQAADDHLESADYKKGLVDIELEVKKHRELKEAEYLVSDLNKMLEEVQHQIKETKKPKGK